MSAYVDTYEAYMCICIQHIKFTYMFFYVWKYMDV